MDDYAKGVEQAGGKFQCPPMDIPTVGRLVSAQDPQGAVFLLFKGSIDYAPPRPPVGSQASSAGMNSLPMAGKLRGPSTPPLFGWKEDSTMDRARWALIEFLITAAPRSAP